ncbi:hypothetical protein NIES4103_68410 [Nostoc sp. NIES-4103]|nr:hypothetical protein NIES4103_68410 [Nostoc sp. NIES-4103]
MFSRSELEAMTLQELKDLCLRYSVKPTGNAGYKVSYITSLMAFPQIALSQSKQGRGIKSPSFGNIQSIGEALDEMREPTNEQMALIRVSLEGRRMEYPERYEQERIYTLYKVKLLLSEVVNLLSQ